MTIESALHEFSEYQRYIKGLSPETIKRYKQHVSFFSRFMNITTLGDVSEASVRSYFFKGRTERSWSASTYRTYHMSLHVFFTWCIKRNYLTENHVEKLELPKLPRSIPRGLTNEQAERLLEVVHNYPYRSEFQRIRNYAVYATFIFTGLRRKELLSLTLTDIDLNRQTIFVRRGKGGRDRIIPLTSKLGIILNKYLEARRTTGKTCPEFFTSLKKNDAFTASALKNLTDDIKEVVDFHFTIHGLRHTFGTLMAEGGCDVYSLREMMGHSDIKTTMIYVSASALHIRSQVVKHPLGNDIPIINSTIAR
ncbi:MAG: tyrosine-type recombinase/integrase [Bacteroidota bacterium]